MSPELLDLISDHFYKFPIKDRTRLRPEIEGRPKPESHRLMTIVDDLVFKHPSLKEGLTRIWNTPCADVEEYAVSDTIMHRVLLPELHQIKVEMDREDLLTLLMYLCFDYPEYCWNGVITYLVYKHPAYEDMILPHLKARTSYMRSALYRAFRDVMNRMFCQNDLFTINTIMKSVHGKWGIPYPTAYAILKEVFPNVIQYNDKEKMFIDPSIEFVPPSEDPTVLEDAPDGVNKILTYGDINFFEHGFPDMHDVISEMRRTPGELNYLTEGKAITFDIQPDHFTQLKMNLEPKTAVLIWMESGNMKHRSLIEYDNVIYALYEGTQTLGPDGCPLVFGWPITRDKEQMQNRFVYECWDTNPIRIAPVSL